MIPKWTVIWWLISATAGLWIVPLLFGHNHDEIHRAIGGTIVTLIVSLCIAFWNER